MTEQPRDWDKELADIDQAIEKQGSAPPPALPAPVPAQERGRPVPPPAPGVARGSVAMTWFWVVLAVLLAAALPLWPYGKTCGLQLFFYLGAAGLALLAGIAGAVHSWRTRRGVAHLLALLAVVVVGVMGAREVLPRIGYAAESQTWLCPAAPEPPAPRTTPPVEGQPAPGGV
jgi:hypothetical protein